MPCWEVRQTSVKLEVSDWALLGRALRAEFGKDWVREERGQYWVYTPESGTFYVKRDAITGSQEAIERESNRVKVAYSRTVVQETAKRFNWRLQDSGVNRFVAQKRG